MFYQLYVQSEWNGYLQVLHALFKIWAWWCWISTDSAQDIITLTIFNSTNIHFQETSDMVHEYMIDITYYLLTTPHVNNLGIHKGNRNINVVPNTTDNMCLELNITVTTTLSNGIVHIYGHKYSWSQSRVLEGTYVYVCFEQSQLCTALFPLCWSK